MRKMKKSLVLTVGMYLIMMSISFAFLLFAFQKSIINSYPTLESTIFYRMTPDELVQASPNGKLDIELEKTQSGTVLQERFRDSVNNNLSVIVAIFCTFLFLSTTGLLMTLYYLQKKESIQLAKDLRNAINDKEIISNNEAIYVAHKAIQERYDEYLQSYKRLHSYVSHDQKNILAVLSASMDINSNEVAKRCIHSLTTSIDDILTVSDHEEMSELIEVDVALICADVCDTYSKAATIQFDFDENSDAVILAKERWIYRAVSNLVDNAVKYGGGNPVHVRVSSKCRTVIIEVIDNGLGISKEKQEEIFRYKYRINEMGRNGYGIGLSLVAHVCNLCNGFVWVESAESKGSHFYLSFPQKSC